jgi:hypothetical protein
MLTNKLVVHIRDHHHLTTCLPKLILTVASAVDDKPAMHDMT